MQFVRAAYNGEKFYAIIEGDKLKRLKHAPYDAIELTKEKYDLGDVRLLAPAEPSKVVCVGKNYMDHVKEISAVFGDSSEKPEAPILFIKPNTSVIGPEDNIVYPNVCKRLDYEAELGIVIGKKAHKIAEGRSKEYILGFTCLNDVTARDIQKREGQWTRGKSFDTFCPIGPVIETELDGYNTDLKAILNGKTVQESNTSCMIHNIDRLLCVMSECMTLLPGDVIATGTPSGIGPMQPGDIIEISIDGIGTLKNTIIEE